ncbi:MAG TPA: fatty acyl-AMP ligase [Puia sp.]|uniref:fatty acyl-AMP ligase n=1 Tax=Puia sp. TaxID=2045100 RepID=UPI002BFAFCEC|nr:fatty acyl-AMP ligase [Puia sp.]HVU98520.1 fatty acyl-AMP ligase [Puia sp.]
MKNDTFSTILHFLHWNALNDPRKDAFCFLNEKGVLTECLSYAELDLYAFKAGVHLQKLTTPGQRILLLFPESIDFVSAFFGALYANLIAVPVQYSYKEIMPHRLNHIINDCKPSLLMTTREVARHITTSHPNLVQNLHSKLALWEDVLTSSDIFTAHHIDSSQKGAYIQYTSGTTGKPKGILVMHDKLLNNLSDMAAVAEHNSTSSTMSWLPFFHDMGLIAGILLSVYNGVTSCLMSATNFLSDPVSWLYNISRFKITHSIAPNFAFELCLANAGRRNKNSLDLSHLRYLANCGEPVIPETILRFEQRFRTAHLKKNVIKPCYGLAEATLKVTAPSMLSPVEYLWVDAEQLVEHRIVVTPPRAKGSRLLVGCGKPPIDTNILIVDPESNAPCQPSTIGEIWISGPSVAREYLNDNEASSYRFNASPADSNDQKQYLRTGDMGFFYNRELYIMGRLQDRLLLNGRFQYPHEIEQCAEKAQPAFRRGRTTAFLYDKEGTQLVLITSMNRVNSQKTRFPNDLFEPVTKSVSQAFGIRSIRICVVKPSHIAVTSSGKLKRSEIQEKYHQGLLQPLYEYSSVS